MKDLGKWQAVSFISRVLSQIIGLSSSIIIPRILSVGEFGVIGLANSIGKSFGVTQNLGLASGSTREISKHSNTQEDIFKIFVTSLFIKYIISFPLAFGLFLFAEKIAVGKYNALEVVTPLRIYAGILIVQNVQSLFNSVVQGMQRFRLLFTYQIAISLINVALFIPLVYFYRANGYFYASLIFNLISSILMGILAMWPLRKYFVLPTKEEFKKISKAVFVVSLGVYAVKIIFTFWEGVGPLVLGLHLDTVQIGLFSLALLYSGKLMTLSDSVTDVNLSVFSKEYSLDSSLFKELFTSNFNKLFAIVAFMAFGATFWRFEIVTLFFGDKYLYSLGLIPAIMYGFVFYSFINIVKSSIFVPAKLIKEIVFCYVLMIAGTLATYAVLTASLFPQEKLFAMALGMLSGAFLCYSATAIIAFNKLKIRLFSVPHAVILVLMAIAIVSGTFFNSYVLQLFSTGFTLVTKLVLFFIYTVIFYLLVKQFKFFNLSDVKLFSKFRRKS